MTWGNGATGTSGVVSAANSLVGSTANDFVGDGGVTPLTNGNYVVGSLAWDNGGTADVGAATWGDGTTGTSGVISPTNSLVGSTSGDRVGSFLMALTNGNYVVASPAWSNGTAANAGAVTWGNGTIGTSGVVSTANSLVGSKADDSVGYAAGVTPLTNGNYVVASPRWNNGSATKAGAVTWGNGTNGTTGVVSAVNSLVGSTANDSVGSGDGSNSGGVTPLRNGNYVVSSSGWDNAGTRDVGAVTWGDGTTGTRGVVSIANSLVGSTANDSIGYGGVTPLTNGNYVVGSPTWDNGGATNAGAVTWGNGSTGTSGFVSALNSLVGTTANDSVGGGGVTPLMNGNYVVMSVNWDNGGTTDAGAVTWENGTTGTTGVVSAANSLVGTKGGDLVGVSGVTPLANGNYVVASGFWSNGATANAGAVTWGNGSTGTTGAVSAANSLVGSTADDFVGYYGATPLTNGNYVVMSNGWDNGGTTNAGAATWGNGTTGTTGVVSAANSLVGSGADDLVGFAMPLTNGNYVVASFAWDNGVLSDACAVTWGSGTRGVSGSITSVNSAIGLRSTTGLQPPVLDDVNGTFIAPFVDEGGGRVRVGLQGSGFKLPPVVTVSAGSLAFTENQAAAVIDTGLTVTDADSTTLVGASVAISENFAAGQDFLSFSDQNGIAGSFDAGTGVLTLSGSASVATYQAALRTVVYANTSDDPSTLPRTVTFFADDGNAPGSAARTIAVTAVNDAPTVTTSTGSLSYVEDQAARLIDAGLTVTDVDSDVVGASVAITANFASGEDVLSFTGQGGIDGTFNAGTGVLWDPLESTCRHASLSIL